MPGENKRRLKMPESELAKKVTKFIKAADKLVQNLKKDAEKLREAAEELKGEEKDGRE